MTQPCAKCVEKNIRPDLYPTYKADCQYCLRLRMEDLDRAFGPSAGAKP